MWKIQRKYLFIELMTTLEFRHTQTLLYRTSKEFRIRLISVFGQYKNRQAADDNLKYPLKQVMLNYSPQHPDALYISEFQFKELGHFSLSRNLEFQIDHIHEKLDINLKKMITKDFGNVVVEIKLNIYQFHTHANAIFGLFTKLLSQSARVIYEVDLSTHDMAGIQLEKRVSLDECLTNKLKILTLCGSDMIFISVEILLIIKVLNINQNGDENFNLVFENLYISYPHTKFQINFHNTSYNFIDKIYSRIPNYFDIQCCKIVSTSFIFDNEENQKNLKIKNCFPKNIFEIHPFFSNICEYVYPNRSQNYLDEYQGVIQIQEYSEISMKLQANANETQKYKCLRNLPKFKIEKAFILKVNQKIEVPLLEDSRTECPPFVRIKFEESEDNWAADILKILKGLYNYENAENLIIEQQVRTVSNFHYYKELAIKIREFKNIETLIFPLECYDGVADDIIEMLKSLNKLESVIFDCAEMVKIQLIEEEAKYISQYAIDNMKELRSIVFNFNYPAGMKKLFGHRRITPLTILFYLNDRINFAFDPRFGIRSIIEDQSNQ